MADAYVPPDAPPDAEIDGNPMIDTDMDNVSDDKDNCRTKPNTDQANEDADNFGDVCDPCPISIMNNDSDLDGVGNACDPRPNLAGDTLVLFEGFNAPVPMTWMRTGMWAFAGGNATVTAGNDELAFLNAPIAPDSRGTVSTLVTPTMIANGVRGVGVALPQARTGESGILCTLYIDGDDRLGLYNVRDNTIFESGDYNWNINTAYMLILDREGNQFNCSAPMGSQQDNQDANITDPTVGVRTSSVSARFAWLMYVDSP